MTDSTAAVPNAHPVNVHLLSRDGFHGDAAVAIRPQPVHPYASIVGPHAPRRFALAAVDAPDASDPHAPPLEIGRTRSGEILSISARKELSPFLWRNVECDEVHFVHAGEITFDTDFGSVSAVSGDFVFIGRSVTYRVRPTSPSLRLIVESPRPIRLAPPAPAGTFKPGQDITYASTADGPVLGSPGPVLLKTFDGTTRVELTEGHDPLGMVVLAEGPAPVFTLPLERIQRLTYYPQGGPPGQFAESDDRGVLFYSISRRPGGRPPQHTNADFDEVIVYHRGPAAYGALTEAGTLAWIPKGIPHQGPVEDTDEEYWAWLIELSSTLRLSPEALDAAVPVETGQFALHPSAGPTSG